MNGLDRAARRRLVWLLLTRGDLGSETLRSDGLPVLQARPTSAGDAGSKAASHPPPPGGGGGSPAESVA